MDSLRFNVAQLLRDPVGSSRRAEIEADLGDLIAGFDRSTGETDEASGGVLSGSVRMMHTDAGVLVQGSLRAEITQACARCLDPVIVPISVQLEEVYCPTVDMLTGKTIVPEEEDRALWIDERHILDLTEVLRQSVLLVTPIHVLCKDDCRGLCPTCGENLNEGPCGCAPEPDARWGPLVELLNQTKSNS